MESFEYEPIRALTPLPVAVIYVSVDEPQADCCPRLPSGYGLLRSATVYLHRIADHVDEVRRLIERCCP